MQKGFTLVELLLVMAVIGILASVLIVNLPNVIDQAKDARIIAALGQTRPIMVQIYTSDGNYDDFKCVGSANSDIIRICADVKKNNKEEVEPIIAYDPSGDKSIKTCIYSKLNSKKGTSDQYYCVDSDGNVGKIAANPNTDCVDGAGKGKCPTELY